MSQSSGQNKLVCLEVVRFVSAVSVLIWHYQHFFYFANQPANFIKEQQPFYSYLHLFYDFGYYGVQVSWCISGFIFFWKYKDAIAEGCVSAQKFLVYRFSRLYPLHIITLLIVLLLQAIYFHHTDHYFVYQYNDLTHFFLQIFLASNWGIEKGYSYNGPIWSVSIEVLVYLIFFLLLKTIGKSFWVNVGIVGFCLLAKVLMGSSPLFDCLAFFYLGGLTAIAYQFLDKTKYISLVTAFAFFSLFFAPIVYYFSSIHHHGFFPSFFIVTYIPTLLFVCAKKINIAPKMQEVLEAFGNLTYSSYLIHFPIQLLIAIYFIRMHQPIPYYSVSFFVGFMLATLIVSYYIYRFFELPAQRYLRVKLAA